MFQKRKQRLLLFLSKKQSGLTWEEFAAKIGVSSYSMLRACYLSERNSLPLAVLPNITRYIPNFKWGSWIAEIREEHWGQAKGGSIALKRWHRVKRQNPLLYNRIQSERFRRCRNYKYVTSAGYEVRSQYELVIAENLIENNVPHQYETMLRCGERILFPDFTICVGSRRSLVEVCGFRSRHNWKRLVEKLYDYMKHQVASVFVVVYLAQDASIAQAVSDSLGPSVHFVKIDDIFSFLSILVPKRRESLHVLAIADALKRSKPVGGKQFHWQHLLRSIPKQYWIDVLNETGLPESEIVIARNRTTLKARLIEATCLAIKYGFVPREALIEMIAGSYNGAAGDHFGSMANLAAIARFSSRSEKFT